MLRQNLSQKMTQKLSPQQIQLMKLLQIPTATLDQRIQEELETNPALDDSDVNESSEVYDLENGEEANQEDQNSDDFELDDYITEYIEDDPTSYKVKSESIQDVEEKTIPIALEHSFHDHLEKQIGMLNLKSDKEFAIAEQIIGSIDIDGYLRREPIAIIDDLLFIQNIEATEQEITHVLGHVQRFEPSGIGARNLQECLILQILDKIDKEPGLNKKSKNIAYKILENHFDLFTKKHYQKLQKNLFLSESELKEAIEEILKLNPKPASGFSHASMQGNQYIVPDFLINNRDGDLELTLNSKNAPDLRINDHYLDMLKTYQDTTKGRRAERKEKEAVMFIKQKIDSAKWFIDAIKQRQETLHNTMYAIMQFQYSYFTTGDERTIRPMILKDISEITGLDISTISRVANSKFVQSEFGTRRLKDFFSESITTQDGTEVSTLEVKNILKDIVEKENKKKPESDEKLKESLRDKGYNIARRTVAKYREQLNIPVARLRKQL